MSEARVHAEEAADIKGWGDKELREAFVAGLAAQRAMRVRRERVMEDAKRRLTVSRVATPRGFDAYRWVALSADMYHLHARVEPGASIYPRRWSEVTIRANTFRDEHGEFRIGWNEEARVVALYHPMMDAPE